MHKEKEAFLESACEQVSYKPIRDSLRKELDDHMEDRLLEYMESGLAKEDAEIRAVNQMGDPVAIGVEFHRLHHLRFSVPMVIALSVLGVISSFAKFSTFTKINGTPVTTWDLFVGNFLGRFDVWLGMIVFFVVGFFGYYCIGKHRVMTASIVLVVVPLLAKATGFSLFAPFRLVDIYPILTIPFLGTILYRYRTRSLLAFTLYGVGIAVVITISLWIKPYDYTLIAQHLIACFILLIVTSIRGWYDGRPKRFVAMFTAIFVCVISVGILLLPYAKAEAKMLVGINTQERTVDSIPYEGIVVRDLLSRSRVFSGVSMSKEEMLEYKSASYFRYNTPETQKIIAEGDYRGISLTYESYMKNLTLLEPLTKETITVDKLMPMYSNSFYPIATLIVKHGWWIGIVVLGAILISYGYLLKISLHMKNKFAFILAFSSCIFLIVQGVGNLLMNFGFSFSTPIELPFSYVLFLVNISDTFLLGLIFTAYRYDRVKTEYHTFDSDTIVRSN